MRGRTGKEGRLEQETEGTRGKREEEGGWKEEDGRKAGGKRVEGGWKEGGRRVEGGGRREETKKSGRKVNLGRSIIKWKESRSYTMPEKPRKASARMLTVMRAMGRPLKDFGTSFRARCSRRPAKRTIARP